MSMLPVPVDGKRNDWPRLVANAVKQLQNIVAGRTSYPFDILDAAPADPGNGQTYYDTTLLKVRTWNGTSWNNHW